MKKVLFSLVVAAGLSACGGGASNTTSTMDSTKMADSAKMSVDSSKMATDSSKMKADTSKMKMDSTKK